MGGGGGLPNGRGAFEVLPYENGGGGGRGVSGKSFRHAEGGHKSFHCLKGGGGARKVLPCLEGGGRKKFWTCDFPIL